MQSLILFSDNFILPDVFVIAWVLDVCRKQYPQLHIHTSYFKGQLDLSTVTCKKSHAIADLEIALVCIFAS